MRALLVILFSLTAQAEYIDLPSLGNPSWKNPVANALALPAVGNTLGDCRSVKDVGTVYCWTGSSWSAPSGSGTVTSVALSLPGIFSVSGSPVTGAGTLTGTLATQTANRVWASATSGGAATPAFRALVAADLPTGALTASGGVTQTGGTGAVIGSGVAIACTAAVDGTTGCMTGTDHTSFTGLKVEQLDGQIDSPSNKTYILRAYASYSGTINNIYIGTASGTITAAVKINGTSVTGLGSISVTSTPATSSATAANTFVAGDQITMVTTSNSSAADLYWSLKVTRN